MVLLRCVDEIEEQHCLNCFFGKFRKSQSNSRISRAYLSGGSERAALASPLLNTIVVLLRKTLNVATAPSCSVLNRGCTGRLPGVNVEQYFFSEMDKEQHLCS